jgi:proline utilization trans-activator
MVDRYGLMKGDDRLIPVASYLKKLEEESQLWKETHTSGRESGKPNSQDQRRQNRVTVIEEGEEGSSANPDVDLRNPLIEDRAWFVPDNASTQPVYIGEAACTAFGTRLRQFLSGNEPVAPLSRSNYSKDKAFLRMSDPSFQLPNRAYAHLMIKVALRFLGNDYHLMLRKTTVERLDALYRYQSFDDPIFLCKLFAVFAMGEMYANRRLSSTKGAGIPGTGFFVQAMSLFQDIHEEATVQYVEALLIIVCSSRTFLLRFLD